MANLEQSRQDSLDSIQEKLNSMDVDTPLDNAQNAIDSLDHGIEIDINEDFVEMCNILRNGNDTEKELVKLKLIVYLSQAGEAIDYDKTDIKVIGAPLSDKDLIILRYEYNEHVVDKNNVGGKFTQYTLRNEGGKWYYGQISGGFSRSKIDG